MTEENPYRIRVVGVGGVGLLIHSFGLIFEYFSKGKSALTIQFIRGEFITDYVPTIEESYMKDVHFDGERRYLDILDTAGQEEYSALRDTYMKGGEGFLMVFSITEQSSLEELDEFYQQILMVKNTESVPMVMCGNKSDLEEDREVEYEAALDFASNMRIPLFETSAKTNRNVEKAFVELAKQIEDIRHQGGEDSFGGIQPIEPTNEEKKKCCTIL